MTHHPLLLSTAMVQAVLANTKLVTRRIPGPTNSLVDGRRVSGKTWKEYDWDMKEYQIDPGPSPAGNPGPYFKFRSKAYDTIHRIYPVYEVGDIIWFRETYRKYYKSDEHGYVDFSKPIIEYAADNPPMILEQDGDGFQVFNKNGSEKFIPWRPSIHLPKSACRLWAEITAVSCQHLQDITEEDAKREGILWYQDEVLGPRFKDYLTDASGYGHPDHDYPTTGDAITSFGTLWQSIHGPESWSANPPVYAISFKILSTTGMPVNQGI